MDFYQGQVVIRDERSLEEEGRRSEQGLLFSS